MRKKNKIPKYWAAIAVTLFVCLASLNILSVALKKQQKLSINLDQVIVLGYLLDDTSDYLTSQARAFSVTGNPRFLRDYWNEVNNVRRRDYVITRIQELGVKDSELQMLEKSKNSSDRLIKTEQLSMVLILIANHVPKNQIPIELKNVDVPDNLANMTQNEKILYAQEILFDSNYNKAKTIIASNVEQFQRTIIAGFRQALETQRRVINYSQIILYVFLAISTGLVMLIIWIKPETFKQPSRKKSKK